MVSVIVCTNSDLIPALIPFGLLDRTQATTVAEEEAGSPVSILSSWCKPSKAAGSSVSLSATLMP